MQVIQVKSITLTRTYLVGCSSAKSKQENKKGAAIKNTQDSGTLEVEEYFNDIFVAGFNSYVQRRLFCDAAVVGR